MLRGSGCVRGGFYVPCQGWPAHNAIRELSLFLSQLLAGATTKNMPNLRNLAMELRKVCCHPVSYSQGVGSMGGVMGGGGGGVMGCGGWLCVPASELATSKRVGHGGSPRVTAVALPSPLSHAYTHILYTHKPPPPPSRSTCAPGWRTISGGAAWRRVAGWPRSWASWLGPAARWCCCTSCCPS